MRALALVGLALAACRGDASAPAPAPPPPGLALPVRVDGQPAAPLTLPGAGTPVDLWPLCATHAAEVIIAKDAHGTFVEGHCAERGGYALTARVIDGRAVARLTTMAAGKVSTIAEASPAAIDVLRPAPPEPAAEPLAITVDGAPVASLTGDEIDELTPVQHHAAGVPLTDVLVAAHVIVPPGDQIVAIGLDQEYVLEPAWLRDPAHAILLKHNRRGLVRLDHTGPRGREGHVRGVRTLAIRRPHA